MNLLALQRNMREHLLRGSEHIAREIRGDAATRLAVYYDAYRMRLMDCLRDTFERVRAWVGDSGFETAAQRHIELHPPHNWTLAEYGNGFDCTLADIYPNDPEIAELAWLDWSLHRAFEGPNAKSLKAHDLSGVNWNSAVLSIVPTLRMRPVVTNCAAIWAAIAEGQTPPAMRRLAATSALRVWRAGFSPNFRTIDPLEHEALLMAAEGATFASICTAIEAARTSEASEVAGGFLASWVQDGLLTSIDSCL